MVAEPALEWSRPVLRDASLTGQLPEALASPAAHTLPDEALVALALEQRERFGELYLRYADRVYRFALARTRSAALADDIVSDTMIAALEGLRGFDARKGSFAGWLFTIAARRIADRDRKQRQFWNFLQRRPPSAADWEEEDALASTLRGETQARVRAAIASLSERHREVIELRYLAELPIRDIAAVLDTTEGAVKMRLNRAMQALARELGEPDGR